MAGVILSTATLFFLFYQKLDFAVLIFLILIFDIIYLKVVKKHKHDTFEIDYYANKSVLKLWNAPAKTLFFILLLFICVFSRHILIQLYIFLINFVIVLMVGKVKLSDYVRILSIPVNFLMLSLITLLFSFSDSAIGIINIPVLGNYLCLTSYSQGYAMAVFFRSIGALSSLYALCLTTPMRDIIKVLKLLRLPNIMIDLMYLIYKYIFILLSTINQMKTSAQSRLGYRNYKTSIKTTVLISSNLFFLSLRKASDSFNAMESRLYDGEIRFLSDNMPLKINQLGFYLIVFIPIIFVELRRIR